MPKGDDARHQGMPCNPYNARILTADQKHQPKSAFQPFTAESLPLVLPRGKQSIIAGTQDFRKYLVHMGL